MSEPNNQLQKLTLAPQYVTPERVKSFFSTELIKRNYQKVLQEIADIKPDKHNVKECHERYKELQKTLKELQEAGKQAGIDYFNAHRIFAAAVSDLLQPLVSAISTLGTEIKVADVEAMAERQQAIREKTRIDSNKAHINNFINNCIGIIPNLSWQGIVNLQKRFGNEISHMDEDFKDDLRKQCESLTPLINERKKALRLAEELQQEHALATANSDDERLVEIKEQMDVLNDHLEINAIRMQETAFETSVQTDILVAEPTIEEAKGRHLWRYRIEDIQLLAKKHPEFVRLVDNKENIDAFLSDKRKDKDFMKQMEYKMEGITFYKEKRY